MKINFVTKTLNNGLYTVDFDSNESPKFYSDCSHGGVFYLFDMLMYARTFSEAIVSDVEDSDIDMELVNMYFASMTLTITDEEHNESLRLEEKGDQGMIITLNNEMPIRIHHSGLLYDQVGSANFHVGIFINMKTPNIAKYLKMGFAGVSIGERRRCVSQYVLNQLSDEFDVKHNLTMMDIVRRYGPHLGSFFAMAMLTDVMMVNSKIHEDPGRDPQPDTIEFVEDQVNDFITRFNPPHAIFVINMIYDKDFEELVFYEEPNRHGVDTMKDFFNKLLESLDKAIENKTDDGSFIESDAYEDIDEDEDDLPARGSIIGGMAFRYNPDTGKFDEGQDIGNMSIDYDEVKELQEEYKDPDKVIDALVDKLRGGMNLSDNILRGVIKEIVDHMNEDDKNDNGGNE